MILPEASGPIFHILTFCGQLQETTAVDCCNMFIERFWNIVGATISSSSSLVMKIHSTPWFFDPRSLEVRKKFRGYFRGTCSDLGNASMEAWGCPQNVGDMNKTWGDSMRNQLDVKESWDATVFDGTQWHRPWNSHIYGVDHVKIRHTGISTSTQHLTLARYTWSPPPQTCNQFIGQQRCELLKPNKTGGGWLENPQHKSMIFPSIFSNAL